MELISQISYDVLVDDTSKRIISILCIAFVTILCLLILSLFKSRKLKTKLKDLEENKNS